MALALTVTDPPDGELITEIEIHKRKPLWRLIAVRVLSGALVLWAAITITFIAIQLTPGDTVSLLLGENRDDPVLREQTIARWGLDQPVWVQYFTYLGRIPSGDFGISYNLRKPVGELIAEGLGPTLQLAFTAAGGAIVIAIVATIITTSALPFIRPIAGFFELILVSTPPFWLAIVLLTVVSFQLGWFSIIDHRSWQALVLPASAMAIPMGAYLTQILRDGVDRALEQPFAVSARARGLSARGVRFRHALRHASLPAVNVVGLIIGSLIGGAVIVEQVFGRPGLGQIAVDAVTVKDVPLILGITLVTTLAFVIASTLVDLVSLIVDPRLRSGLGV